MEGLLIVILFVSISSPAYSKRSLLWNLRPDNADVDKFTLQLEMSIPFLYSMVAVKFFQTELSQTVSFPLTEALNEQALVSSN